MFWRKRVNIFEKLGCNIPSNRTEACHRVSKKSATVVIKFSRRKDCQRALDVKKDLCKSKMDDVNLPGQNKLINKSLCPYYKVLWSKNKKLHSLGKINSFFIWVTQSISMLVKIVCRCPQLKLMTSGKNFLTFICHHLNVLGSLREPHLC